MATIKAILKKNKGKYVVNQNGLSVVYLQYGHSGRSCLFSTQVKVDPKYWIGDRDQQNPISRSLRGYSTQLEYIHRCKDRLNKALTTIKLMDLEPSVDNVKSHYNQTFNRGGDGSAIKLFEAFINQSIGSKAPGTIKQYQSCLNNLRHYIKQKGIGITLQNITLKFYNDYLNHLLIDLNMSSNTAGNQIKNLKAFLNDCRRKGHILQVDISEFKVTREKGDIIYLTEQELLSLINFVSNSKRLNKTRDVFVVQCCTGLRYSDLSRLGSQHIFDNKIKIKAHKTKKQVFVPMRPTVIKILKQYNYELPIISEQNYNYAIKELCELAGLVDEIEVTEVRGGRKLYNTVPKYQVISSHTAVKTFITHCLEKGISPKVVAEMTGKSVRVILDHYYGTNEATIEEEMSNAFSDF